MKKLLIIIGLISVSYISADAQISEYNTNNNTQKNRTPIDNNVPVKNPNQITNYYQNNSAYNNNSTQSNNQGNPATNTTTDHGTYIDPTRSNINTNPNGTSTEGVNTHGTMNDGTTGSNVNNGIVK